MGLKQSELTNNQRKDYWKARDGGNGTKQSRLTGEQRRAFQNVRDTKPE
jgi:hypothetical protein